MPVATQLWLGGSTVAVAMALLWLVEWKRSDATHVDVAWAFGIGGLGVFYMMTTLENSMRVFLVTAMAGIWSLRLGGYLLFTRVFGRREEDGRYRELRARWGSRAHGYFFIVFQAQAILAWIFSLPILAAMKNPAPVPRVWEYLALAIWAIAILGESLADRQLARFRARPDSRGRTCREGLWRYSRHPNYFFEWLGWWAYVAACVGSWWVLVALVGPSLLGFLLFRVTGIPATEAQALRTRGEDYRSYQRSTSAFVPWFPKPE